MTREEALDIIEKEPYPSKAAEAQKEYVAKKLGFSMDEFNQLMNMPPKSHDDFDSEKYKYDFILKITSLINKANF